MEWTIQLYSQALAWSIWMYTGLKIACLVQVQQLILIQAGGQGNVSRASVGLLYRISRNALTILQRVGLY